MAKDTTQYPDRVYMTEMEKKLRRKRSTIVTWDKKGWLPEDLEFQRDENGWRYWTREQLKQAIAWVNHPDRRRAPELYAD